MEHKEEFRTIEFDGHKMQVSNYGYCSMKTDIDGDGYEYIKKYAIYIHRLVAKAFPEICGEWFEGCHIHHKNHIKTDNNAWNLVVVTPSEHSKIHSEERKDNPKYYVNDYKGIIVKYDKDWNPIKTYKNAKEILYDTIFSYKTIRKAIKNGNLLDGHYYVKI